MAIAAQEAKTIITLEGNNRASATLRAVRSDMDGLGSSAAHNTAGLKAMGKHGGDAAAKISQGLRDHIGIIGDLAAEMTGLGEGAKLAANGLRFMHSPASLVGVAIGGAAAGAYMFYRHVVETNAQLAQLGNGVTLKLAKDLDLSQKSAIGLQNAMADLSAKGRLQPTNLALQEIGRNAKLIGEDSDVAMIAAVDAFAKGGEAITAFERKFGRIGAGFGSLSDAAKRFGIDAKLAEISEKELTAQEKIKKTLLDQVVAENNLVLATKNRVRETVGSRSHTVSAAGGDLARAEEDAARDKTRELAAQQKELQGQLYAQEALKISGKQYEATIKVIDRAIGHAAGETRSQGAADRQITAELVKQEVIRDRLAALDVLQGVVDKDLLQAERDKVADESEKSQKSVNAAFKEKAELQKAAKDKASAAAAAAKSHRDELAAKDIAQMKATSTRDQLVDESSATSPDELAAARAKAARIAIDAEIREVMRDTKKGVVEKTALVQSIELKAKLALVAQQKEIDDKSEQLLRQREDAEQSVGDARLSRDLAAAQESGDLERAAALEKKQIETELGKQLRAIDLEVAEAAKTLRADDLDNFKAMAGAKAKLAGESADVKIGEVDHKGMRESIDKVQAGIAPAMDAVGRSGGKGAAALSAAAKGAFDVAKNWKGMKASAPDAISAVGAVAASLVDGEREKAGIMAVTEAAAAAASYPSIPGMISHGVAAALYASVATGLVGSTGSSAPGAAAAGAGAAASGGGSGSFGGGGQAQQVNVFLGYWGGTSQQAGLAAQKAIKSLHGTGYALPKAA